MFGRVIGWVRASARNECMLFLMKIFFRENNFIRFNSATNDGGISPKKNQFEVGQ